MSGAKRTEYTTSDLAGVVFQPGRMAGHPAPVDVRHRAARGHHRSGRRQLAGTVAPGMFIRVLVFGLLSAVFTPLNAADLPDPTRPPSMFAGSVASPGRGSSEGRSKGLQSTIISKSRRAAIIDGKTVELWAKHGNAQLIEVNEGSVVLQGGKTRRVLTLFPGVKMTQREIKTNHAPPASGAQPDETSNTPAAQDEQPLSGHPKEKK